MLVVPVYRNLHHSSATRDKAFQALGEGDFKYDSRDVDLAHFMISMIVKNIIDATDQFWGVFLLLKILIHLIQNHQVHRLCCRVANYFS